MRLLELKLTNFKGIKSFHLKLDGKGAEIYGDNATGKTTLFDAYLWLLFGKDSSGRSDFDLKTLDASGKALSGLSHEVEATFDIGQARDYKLRKVYIENWTKKRGSAEAEFTGHTTDHFIDGVPVSKKVYADTIAEICDEDKFKLLSSPAYFNEQLHWQKRREVLLSVCGDITDTDVIASSKDLKDLPDILNGRALEDHRKVIAARRSEINKQLQQIPSRIDEAERGLPDVTGLNAKKLTADIESLEIQRRGKEDEKLRIESGGEIAEKTKALREVEADILAAKNTFNLTTASLKEGKQTEVRATQRLIDDLKADIEKAERRITHNDVEIKRLEAKAEQLREDWRGEEKKTFEYEANDTCPACSQKLPKAEVETARENALAQFNKTKAEKLELIDSFGKQVKEEIAQLQSETVQDQKEIAAFKENITEREDWLKAVEKELDSMTGELTDDPAYLELVEKEGAIEQEIAGLKIKSHSIVAGLSVQIEDIRGQAANLSADLTKLEYRSTGEERITELKAQEKDLAREYEKLERELFLTEEFVRAKVSLLEDKINSRFKLARFKLFDIQVNGGIQECCDTTVNGVPYSSGLNHGAQIAVGLDIINTLSEHYGFTAPIFIDNAEAITNFSAEGQIISLYVSEKDKQLRIEGGS